MEDPRSCLVDWRTALLFCLTAVFAAHRTMLEVFIHHFDFFTVYSYTFQGKAWLQQSGQIPFWNTTMSSGLSYVSNGPLFFSLNRLLAYAGLSVQMATATVEWLCIASASIGLYALLRLYGVGRGGALAAGVLQQYFACTWWALENYPGALLTLSLLLCELYEQRRRPLYLYLNALLVAVFCTTAIPHGILILFACQAVYAVARWLDGTGRGFALATFASWLPGMVMAAPALLPTARDAAQSYRIYFVRPFLGMEHMPPLEFIWYVLNVGFQLSNLGPALFVAAALGLPAFFLTKRRGLRTLMAVYALCEGLIVLITLNQQLTQYIPVIGKLLNAFDMQRNFVLPFLMAFCAGVGVDALAKGVDEGAKPGLRRRLAVFLLVLAAAWLLGGNRFREYTLVAALGVGGYYWFSLRPGVDAVRRCGPRFFALLCLFCVFVLAQSHVKDMRRTAQLGLPPVASAVSDEAMVARSAKPLDENDRNTAELVRVLRENTSRELSRAMDRDVLDLSGKSFYALHGIPTLFYFDNTSPARSREYFMWMIDDLRTANPERYTSLWENSSFYAKDGSRFNTAMLSLAGVRWIIEPKDMAEERFAHVWSGDKLALYRNDQAFPRAFAVSGMRVVEDKQAMARALMGADVEALRAAVLVRREDAPALPEGWLPADGQASAEVRVAAYTPNEVLVDVEARANCLVVLTDTFHPAWKAEVDGRPVSISAAYNMYRMVPVPAGAHRVRFFFQDDLFRTSVGIMAGVWALMTLWLLWAERRRNNPQPGAGA